MPGWQDVSPGHPGREQGALLLCNSTKRHRSLWKRCLALTNVIRQRDGREPAQPWALPDSP